MRFIPLSKDDYDDLPEHMQREADVLNSLAEKHPILFWGGLILIIVAEFGFIFFMVGV